MKKDTVIALDKSVKHWEKNLKKANKKTLQLGNISCNECALCDRFDKDCVAEGREICPVALNTGYIGCFNSPWVKVNSLLIVDKIDWKEVEEAVANQVKFLKSLK